MISVAEALGRLFALLGPVREETVPLEAAVGRVLLRPVSALRDQPPFDSSAMDGWAVRRADASPGARLRIMGEAAAGKGFAGRLAEGQTVRILTGAPLPEGADAVVIQEEVVREGDHVRLSPDAVAGHVRPRGGDFAAGATMAVPRRLRPADIALLAAFGHPALSVARRPEVAILSTGDELVMPGERPGPDQIFAANAFGLHALLTEAGAAPRILPVVPDDREALSYALSLTDGADLVLTIGGASVGDHDLVAPVAQAAGAELSFHKVAMRPGKPLLAGRFPDGRLLLGLPGNPVSAMVCAIVFLRPMILAMLGLPPQPAPRQTAVLGAALPAGGPREHYLRARLGPDGRVMPFPRQDSSLLSVLAEADCLLLQPAGSPPLSEGARVEILPI